MREKSKPHRSLSEKNVDGSTSTTPATTIVVTPSTTTTTTTSTISTMLIPTSTKFAVIGGDTGGGSSDMESTSMQIESITANSADPKPDIYFQQLIIQQQTKKKRPSNNNNTEVHSITKNSTRRHAASLKSEGGTDYSDYHHSELDESEDLKSMGEESMNEDETTTRPYSRRGSKRKPIPQNQDHNGNSNDDDKSEDNEKEEQGLSSVQKYILRALKAHNGEAHLSSIQSYLSNVMSPKKWKKLRKRDGSKYTYDHKRVIAASLSNTSSVNPLFLRCPERDGWWLIGPRGKTIELPEESEEEQDGDDEDDTKQIKDEADDESSKKKSDTDDQKKQDGEKSSPTSSSNESSGQANMSLKIQMQHVPLSRKKRLSQSPAKPITRGATAAASTTSNNNGNNNGNDSGSDSLSVSPPLIIKEEQSLESTEVNNGESNNINNNNGHTHTPISLRRKAANKKRKADEDDQTSTTSTTTTTTTTTSTSNNIKTESSTNEKVDSSSSPPPSSTNTNTNTTSPPTPFSTRSKNKAVGKTTPPPVQDETSPSLNGKNGSSTPTSTNASSSSTTTPIRKRIPMKRFKLQTDDGTDSATTPNTNSDDEANKSNSDSNDDQSDDESSSEENSLLDGPTHVLDVAALALTENGGSCSLKSIVNYIKEFLNTLHCTINQNNEKLQKIKASKELPPLDEVSLKNNVEKGLTDFPTRFQRDSKQPDTWHLVKSAKNMHSMRSSARTLSPPFQPASITTRKQRTKNPPRSSNKK